MPYRAKHAKRFFEQLRKVHHLIDDGRTEDFVPVKVAILDTGIRETHRLRKTLEDYSDFVDKGFKYQGKHGLAMDNSGHGSDMVELLNRAAPYASIYVARVFATDGGDADTAENVARVLKLPILKAQSDYCVVGNRARQRCVESRHYINVLWVCCSSPKPNIGASH
jgi:hypothetical protein